MWKGKASIVLLDNSITHFSIEAIELAVENQIELMGFPPNCTPWAQPMDQIFQHLRQAVEEVAIALRMVNTNSTLSKNNFSLVLKYALPRGLTKSRVSGAFKSCGIFPFNPSAIDRSYISVLDPIIQMPNYDNSPLPNEQNEENTDELNDNYDELHTTTLANGGTVENVFGTQNETTYYYPTTKFLKSQMVERMNSSLNNQHPPHPSHIVVQSIEEKLKNNKKSKEPFSLKRKGKENWQPKKREETQRKKEEAKRKREREKALAEKLREEKSKTKKVKQNKKSCSEKQESEQILQNIQIMMWCNCSLSKLKITLLSTYL
ncbi:hypothetical protein KUTeg_023903 [Tegillarca granosa]|uniref:DDE-1 domain-containing protein n=1 Tax=Tegillarca granosa TaxID=220873 RepID=A0ABQ9E1F4_TEGGR|nr:hypothetical protein KUTeg_023903 [Tegillarca granosa]